VGNFLDNFRAQTNGAAEEKDRDSLQLLGALIGRTFVGRSLRDGGVPTIIPRTDFESAAGQEVCVRYFLLVKGADDHDCLGTAAVGHVIDDADVVCRRHAGFVGRRAQGGHRQP